MVDSILSIKASGIDNDTILNDLNLPEGKSIAQLIYEQKKQEKIPTQDKPQSAQ